MNNPVSLIRYEKPLESVKKSIELCEGFNGLSANSKVFIKPNIVYWNRKVSFPKWGLISTSRILEDIVILLKEAGISDITIGEGGLWEPKDRDTPSHAFETLGYNRLKKRYALKVINIFERPFRTINITSGVNLSFNKDFLESDFLVNLPVLKTHSQTVVSLGCKNLKGLLDIESRKFCHSKDKEKDLNYMISLLPDIIPPSLTLIDGIYTNERGPLFGTIKRSNILIASRDIISADKVGISILGHLPSYVPHISYLCRHKKRPLDLSDIDIKGENLKDLTDYHEYTLPYNSDGTLPLDLYNRGIKGLTFRNPGSSICTYCAILSGLMSAAIGLAWKGEAWDDVEILSGKSMEPLSGKKKTILLGKCIYMAHRTNPHIKKIYPVKGCPPDSEELIKILHSLEIEVNPLIIKNPDILIGSLMDIYKDSPEFDENLFKLP